MISLSTAQPSVGGSAPSLPTRIVRFKRPKPVPFLYASMSKLILFCQSLIETQLDSYNRLVSILSACVCECQRRSDVVDLYRPLNQLNYMYMYIHLLMIQNVLALYTGKIIVQLKYSGPPPPPFEMRTPLY